MDILEVKLTECADELAMIEGEQKGNQGCHLDFSLEQYVNCDIYTLTKIWADEKTATRSNKSLFRVCFIRDVFIVFKWRCQAE